MVKLKVGLEIHAYLSTNEKLFCRCKVSRERGLEPNITKYIYLSHMLWNAGCKTNGS